MTQDSDDLLAMVFSAPIHLPPTQVKSDGGNVVVTTSESRHVETHHTVTHHEEVHTSTSVQESHHSHSESHQVHSEGHIGSSDAVESGHFDYDNESERNRAASSAMSSATSVSVRSSVSQQQSQHHESGGKHEAHRAIMQSYAMNKSGFTSDGDGSSVTVVSSHRHTEREETPTVKSEASTTIAPVRTPIHDAVIQQFKSLHKRESVASSITDQEDSHRKYYEKEPSEGEVKSEEVIRYGFDSNEIQKSHSKQEVPENVHLLKYQEIVYEPIEKTVNMSSVQVVEHHQHEEQHTTEEHVVSHETRIHESDDEPFTFDRVEYVTENVEHEPHLEHISSEPIVTEVIHEQTTSQPHSRTHSAGEQKNFYSQEMQVSSSHHSSSHEVTQNFHSSQENVERRSQQSLSSNTKMYDPYAVTTKSDTSLHKHEDVEEKELVPRVAGPKVRDNLRPVSLNSSTYKVTEYKFVSASDHHKDGGQKSSESESQRRHSQSRHSHKEHRHHRPKQIDVDSLRSDSQDDIEIRTEMHFSPASTLVRQAVRPNLDLPPNTGAVKLLRERIELGENQTERKEVKEIDIFESLDDNRNYKGEDIPRSQIKEENRHTFHELYYRQPFGVPNAHVEHHQYHSSSGVSSFNDSDIQQHVESEQQKYQQDLRRVSQTSGKQNIYESNEHQVNLRNVGKTYEEQASQQRYVQHHVEPQYQQQQQQYDQQVNLRSVGRIYEEQGRQQRYVQPHVEPQYQQKQDLRRVSLTSGKQNIHQSNDQQVNLRNVTHTYGGQSTQQGHIQRYAEVQNQQKQYDQQITTDTRNFNQTSGRQTFQSSYNQERNDTTHQLQHRDTSKQTYSHNETYRPSEQLHCTCNSCAIHGRNAAHQTAAVTKHKDEIKELSYDVGNRAQQHGGYQKSVSNVSHTGSGTVLQQKSDLHDDSKTHKRTSSIHRIEDVVHSTGGVQVGGGVVGNVVDTRTAQGEIYTTRTSAYAPHAQQRQVTSPAVSAPTPPVAPAPTLVAPAAVARTSRAQHDEKYNSMRVVRNVRAFVNEWGQKDFQPPYPPGAVTQTSLPRSPVTPTFPENKVSTTVRSVTASAPKVTSSGSVTSGNESAQTRTNVTKEQTIVKTESHLVGKGGTTSHQQIVSTTALHAPVPAKRESVVIAPARTVPVLLEPAHHHHDYHCCCCPHHCYHEHQCQFCQQQQQQQELYLQQSTKIPAVQTLTYKSEQSQPMLKYESYTTQSGTLDLQDEQHKGNADAEESFRLVPVSVRRADYEMKSAQSTNVGRSSGMKPVIDVFSV
ncbi:hypothetical protein RB195_026143 [Necator americanus]|uniref:Uncharacterized protein n=1 Tax=Necator americanus TaxID=51031 RepID=A0ABR1EVM2_NECAM